MKKGLAAQLAAIDKAQAAREVTAGVIEQETGSFVESMKQLYEPLMGQMGEGMDIMDMFSDPAKFTQALDAFYANPQYKVLMENSARALERKQAASGDRYSGSQLAALSAEAQRQGNIYFGEFADRQLAIAKTKMGIGEMGISGVAGAEQAGYQGAVGVAEMRDKGQAELQKGAAWGNYFAGKASSAASTRGTIGQLAGMAIGAFAGPLGAAVGGAVGGMFGGGGGVPATGGGADGTAGGNVGLNANNLNLGY